jgi:hypothetical protein
LTRNAFGSSFRGLGIKVLSSDIESVLEIGELKVNVRSIKALALERLQVGEISIVGISRKRMSPSEPAG